MPMVQVRGANLYYETNGKGVPLVLCHEFAGSHESWKVQIEYFSSKYLVVTYNARGYPPSDVPDNIESYSQELAVEDLYHLLGHLGIQKAHLCGLSMGSHTTLHFGLKYPSMTQALIVAGLNGWSTEPGASRRKGAALADRLETQGINAMGDYTRSPTRIQLLRKRREVWTEFDNLFQNQSPKGLAMSLRGILGRRPSIFDLKPELLELKIPTLIIAGEEDIPCIEPAKFMKRWISTSSLALFPGTGHTVNLEEPELFNDTVGSFLTEIDERRINWATDTV